MILLMTLSLSASATVLLQPYLTKILIDDGLLGKSFTTLLIVASVMLLIGFASTGLAGINRYIHTQLSATILFKLREFVYSHLQTLSPTFYAKQRTGDLLSRLDGDIAELQRFAIDGLFASVSGILGLIGAVTMMFLLSWQLALLLLILIPLQWFYLSRMRPRVERQTRKMRERSADISSFLAETLPNMKQIQSSVAEEREHARLKLLNQSYLKDLLKLQWIEFATSAIPSSLTSLTRAIAFLVGGYWVIQGQLALGALVAFITYLGMAVGPVQTLLGLYMAWQRFTVSLERVQHLMNYEPEVVSTRNAPVPLSLRGNLEIKCLSFGYHEQSAPLFQNTSAYIPAGSKVGIYGPSGIGKTTLADLIMRHLSPTTGHILVDGQDIAHYKVRDWRRHVALVAQDIALFRGTIAENIRYSVPTASIEEVRLAAVRANLFSFIAELPQGLDSFVGERGAQLSGGQKQRIAVARALLQQPILVIFDEATSAIDLHTEQQLMAEVDALFENTTRLVISHRKTPLLDADLLLTIAEGKIQVSDNSASSGQTHKIIRHA
ncbi:MAG: ABC transporter ATP-binding protein/permease [Pseudomonadales bacterium]|nr:ABC transporter ATP-binding protein/permease [Pseudomonadales bacterium]